MKRYSGRSSAANTAHGEAGFWPSYADMMSAVALILFFLMLLAYIQNLVTGNNLRSTQEALEDTRSALVLTTAQVESAEKELSLITADLDEAKADLGKQQALIAQQKASIDKQKDTIAAQNATIAAQDKQTAEIEKYLIQTQAELREVRGQMQTIAVLRLSILEQMKESIEKVMGNGGTVSIGDNGSIILSESVLFDLGSSDVKPESTKMLDQLSRVFVSFLSDNENAKYVDSIVISGHTDNTGNEESNRSLSTERANSVLNYLLTTNNSRLNKYSSYFCSAGYGTTRPVDTNSTIEGRAANRRIEISIILKDESVLDIVEQYLAIEMPKNG